jgi:hypothetical protein
MFNISSDAVKFSECKLLTKKSDFHSAFWCGKLYYIVRNEFELAKVFEGLWCSLEHHFIISVSLKK